MAIAISSTLGNLTLRLKGYNDCDNVYLCWRIIDSQGSDTPVTDCLGFKIERQRIMSDGNWSDSEVLRNRVGFSHQKIDVSKPDEATQPSSIWPFQRYDWTDHGASNGETVRYRVTAVGTPNLGKKLGTVELKELLQSDWTEAVEVTANAGNGVHIYFNRGTVMSQFVARVARENEWSAVDIKKHVEDIQEPLRMFLSGELKAALLKLLIDVIANPFWSVYAALYELSDEELIGKLSLLKDRANIVLSDGSNLDSVKKVYRDGNAPARKALKKAGVNVHDRILAKLGLGHNKFLVVVDSRTDEPLIAWTGSTNWTPTGLCTQLNNGVLFENRDIAKVFYGQWKNLKKAMSAFPKALLDGNASPQRIKDLEIWFTRAPKPKPATETPIDIKYLMDLIDGAKKSILYVMFQPGAEPLLSIVKKRADPSIYVRGVVSTLIASNKEKFELVTNDQEDSYTTDLKQPDGVSKDLRWWIKEVTRGQFIPYNGRPGIGFAITHTKMIVIDPFEKDCKVITGSHNFSHSASQDNDENFVIIHGSKEIAEHYAVASIAMFNHYRWRAYMKAMADSGKEPWSNLNSSPVWQKNYQGQRLTSHLDHWCA